MIVISVSAFLGGVLSAFLGWLESGEPFEPRKFGKSVGVALLSGLSFAVAFASTGVETKDLILAFLSGAGIDAITNRALGSWK